MARVNDGHIHALFTSGAVMLHDALQYVFNAEEEELAAAAISARLLDSPAVCRVDGPKRTSICETPRYQGGMLGLAVFSPSECARCNSTIEVDDLPDAALAVLDAMRAASEVVHPSDVLAFLGGPVLPIWSEQRRWFAPAYELDAVHAAYIDRKFPYRQPTPMARILECAVNAPFMTERQKEACRAPPHAG